MNVRDRVEKLERLARDESATPDERDAALRAIARLNERLISEARGVDESR